MIQNCIWYTMDTYYKEQAICYLLPFCLMICTVRDHLGNKYVTCMLVEYLDSPVTKSPQPQTYVRYSFSLTINSYPCSMNSDLCSSTILMFWCLFWLLATYLEILPSPDKFSRFLHVTSYMNKSLRDHVILLLHFRS